MAPPNAGNASLPFVDLIALEKINATTYRSRAEPFSPGGGSRSYGGHVYAQAAWAAAQTVEPGFVVHNVTGFFILGGLTNIPFIYSVKTIRNGRSYCTRIVNVTQAEGQGICFTCTCSFKLAEDSPLDVQEKIDLEETYAVSLKNKRPEDWPISPGMDLPWYAKKIEESGLVEEHSGLDTRKVDMTSFNRSLTPFERRQLYYYQLIGNLPRDPNIHACAHLYASDLNSLFVVANHFDVADKFDGSFHAQMASLSHTVVFHVPAADLMMDKTGGQKVWFCKEDWTTRAAGGRGIHNSRLIGPNGLHVASTWQEGVVRIGKKTSKETRVQSASKL